MGEGALTAVQEGAREVIEGALAGLLFTAVALQSRLVVICPPGTNIVALTSGTLEGTILPPQRMDVCLTFNWLQVLGTTERSQVDHRVGQQLHAIMPLLDAFKSE